MRFCIDFMLFSMKGDRLRRELANRLRRARLDVYGDMSQADFAQLIRVGQSQISRWESAKSLPRVLELVRFAEKCNVTLEELISGLAEPTARQLRLPLEALGPDARPVVVKLIALLRTRETLRKARRRRSI